MKKTVEDFFSSLNKEERGIAERLYPLENEFFQVRKEKEEYERAGKKFKAWLLSRKEDKITKQMLNLHRIEGNTWTAFQVWYKVKEYINS